MIRFTKIALLASVLCFGGSIVGAITGGDDPNNRLDASLRASWLFCLAGVFLGRFVFLRKRNALTFARWRVFWSWFVGAYFVAYIPLAILLPRQQMIPLPWVDAAAFLSACIFAYASSMLGVLQRDTKLRVALCERTPVTKGVLDKARDGNLDEAYDMVEQATKRCGGIVRAEDQKAKLHLALGLVRLREGQIDQAAAELERAASFDSKSEYVRLRIGSTFSDAGRHVEACDMLEELSSRAKDDDIVKQARKMLKGIKKGARLVIRCPNCARQLTGSTDMVGDKALCPKCKSEFVISRQP
jgi:predicted Zn-ribbon and HTH transcriptional regulator